MADILKLLKIRYIKPIMGLKDNIIIKSILSLSSWIGSTFTGIFQVEVELIILLLLTIIGDWISGIIRAKRQGVFIRSLGFRQTIVKIIEYAIFLFILTGISNVFGGTEIKGWIGDSLRLLNNIEWFGYFYITFTEIKSIAENLAGKEGALSKIIQSIHEKVFGDMEDEHNR